MSVPLVYVRGRSQGLRRPYRAFSSKPLRFWPDRSQWLMSRLKGLAVGRRLVVSCCACHSEAEMARLDDIVEFYAILDRLNKRIGGERTLGPSVGRMAWPQRGVYFFMEDCECRSDTGIGSRVVRIGLSVMDVLATTLAMATFAYCISFIAAFTASFSNGRMSASCAFNLAPQSAVALSHSAVNFLAFSRVHQKFSCTNCGRRLTVEEPNTSTGQMSWPLHSFLVRRSAALPNCTSY
jgi:hypothetical protein